MHYRGDTETGGDDWRGRESEDPDDGPRFSPGPPVTPELMERARRVALEILAEVKGASDGNRS